MHIVLWVATSVLALDAFFLLGILARHIKDAGPPVSIIELAPLVAVAGVVTALIAFLFNLRRARSEDVLEAATEMLERAHDSLLSKDGDLMSRRLSWLSAARLIATAEQLSKNLKEESHILIYTTKREYWRNRLHETLIPNSPEGLPSTFYADRPEDMISYSDRTREPLSEKSIAYLHRFIRWPRDVRDPIGSERNFTDEEIEDLQAFGPRGLGNLMSQVRKVQHQPRSDDA